MKAFHLVNLAMQNQHLGVFQPLMFRVQSSVVGGILVKFMSQVVGPYHWILWWSLNHSFICLYGSMSLVIP